MINKDIRKMCLCRVHHCTYGHEVPVKWHFCQQCYDNFKSTSGKIDFAQYNVEIRCQNKQVNLFDSKPSVEIRYQNKQVNLFDPKLTAVCAVKPKIPTPFLQVPAIQIQIQIQIQSRHTPWIKGRITPQNYGSPL